MLEWSALAAENEKIERLEKVLARAQEIAESYPRPGSYIFSVEKRIERDAQFRYVYQLRIKLAAAKARAKRHQDRLKNR